GPQHVARREQVELLRDHLDAARIASRPAGRRNRQAQERRREGERLHRTSCGWVNDFALGMIASASTPSHCSDSAAYTPRKSAVALRLPSASRPPESPGYSPTIVPVVCVPRRKPAPAAPG